MGQRFAGVFLAVVSWLIGVVGAFALFTGIALSVSLKTRASAVVVGSEWFLYLGMILGGGIAMFGGNVAMQVGHWIAGKNEWSYSSNPVRTACGKATREIVTVLGFVGVAAGVLWVGLLVLYRDFATLWFALGFLVVGLGLLAGMIWWSKREGRKPI